MRKKKSIHLNFLKLSNIKISLNYFKKNLFHKKKVSTSFKPNKKFFSSTNKVFYKNKKISKFILITFLVLVVSSLTFIGFWLNSFDLYVRSLFIDKFNFVNQNKCINLDQNKLSFVLVEIDSDFRINNLFYFLKLKDQSVLIKMQESLIKKANEVVGNNNSLLLAYFNYTGLNYFYSNLRNILFESFNIKVDFFVIFKSLDKFQNFIEINKFNIFFKFLNKDYIEKYLTSLDVIFDTNICKTDILSFIDLLTKIDFKSEVNVNNLSDITKFLNILHVYKEQIRIYIENKSGSDVLGIIFKKLFQNYGIDVVKLDFSYEIIDKTQLYLNSDNLKNAQNTIFLLDFLLKWDNLVYDYIDYNQNVFAEVTIVLGRDYINIFFSK